MNTIEYGDTTIDKAGLKYTMDGGAEGHDTNSSIDEIMHNLIDLGASNVSIHHLHDKYWSFHFTIHKHYPKNKNIFYYPN